MYNRYLWSGSKGKIESCVVKPPLLWMLEIDDRTGTTAMADQINRIAKYFGDDDAMSSDIVFNTEGMLAEFTDTAIDFTESYEDDGCDPEDHNPDSPPIARLLDLIIQELRTLNAERVVITPIGDAASVEFEIDGKMIERDRLPMRVFLILAKRIADGSKESAVRDGIKVKIHESDLGSIIEMRHKLD